MIKFKIGLKFIVVVVIKTKTFVLIILETHHSKTSAKNNRQIHCKMKRIKTALTLSHIKRNM